MDWLWLLLEETRELAKMESKILLESLSSIERLTRTRIRDRMTSSTPSKTSRKMAMMESRSRVSLLPLMSTRS